MKQLTVGGMGLPSALVSASMAVVYRGSCSWAGSPWPSPAALGATLLTEVGQKRRQEESFAHSASIFWPPAMYQWLSSTWGINQ